MLGEPANLPTPWAQSGMGALLCRIRFGDGSLGAGCRRSPGGTKELERVSRDVVNRLEQEITAARSGQATEAATG